MRRSRSSGQAVLHLGSSSRPRILWLAVALLVFTILPGIAISDCIDYRDPVNPLISSIQTPGHALDVSIEGEYAFIADNYAGLTVVDIADPLHPAIVATLPTPLPNSLLEVRDSRAYIGDGEAGLVIADVTDPLAPVILSALNTPDIPLDLAVSANVVYLADRIGGLLLIDVSDPAAPYIVGTYHPAAWLGAVAVSGHFAFVQTTVGFQVIDVSSPQSPSLVAALPEIVGDGLSLNGPYVYVATAYSGLTVIHVSDPLAPRVVGRVPTAALVTDIEFSNGVAYLAENSTGIEVFDISNPENPVRDGSYNTPGWATGIAFHRGEVYVADDNHLHVLHSHCRPTSEVTGAHTPVLSLRALPNPSTGPTEFRYATGAPGPVHAVIYDAVGRRVRSLVNRIEGAGEHAVSWDGFDDQGRPVSAGLYLVRIGNGETARTESLVIVR